MEAESTNDLITNMMLCPYCNARPRITTDCYGKTYSVQCSKSAQHGNMKSTNLDTAINKWNTRARVDET